MKNIAEILKTMPKGTALYSVDYGNCYLETVWGANLIEAYYYDYSETPKKKITILFDHYGKPLLNGAIVDNNCSLFPSTEMRDWNKFELDEGKHQFKPFEKVIVRNKDSDIWVINLFSHYEEQEDNKMYYHCLNGVFCECIPFTEKTEKLVGTTRIFDTQFNVQKMH